MNDEPAGCTHPTPPDEECQICADGKMRAQMAADFATIPVPANGPMRRARTLVEAHIAVYGMVPHPDKIKELIALELGLAEMRGMDRVRAERDSWKEQFERAANAASEYSEFLLCARRPV